MNKLSFYRDYLSKLDCVQESSDKYNKYKDYQTPFNEVYFGKSNNLKTCENIIGKIRTGDKINININQSKEIKMFNRLIEGQFGFEAFNLIIDSSGGINAGTAPISLCIDAPNLKPSATKEGFRYDSIKGSIAVVYLNQGLLFNKDFTNGEIMGLIMHEIGHNFETAISPVSRGFSYITRAVSLVTLPLTFFPNKYAPNAFSFTRRWYYNLLNRLREDKNIVIEIIDGMDFIINKIIGVLGVVGDSVQSILKIITGPAVPIPSIFDILDFFNSGFGLVGFKGESLADNFATAYGYGPELMSALNKMKQKDMGFVDRSIIRRIPFIGTWYDLCLLPNVVINSIIKSHPNNSFRAKHQIEMLEKELQRSDFDNKMKKSIKNQIDELYKVLDLITGYENYGDSNLQNGFIFTDAYQAFCLALFNGDLRRFVASGNFKEFDKAYDEALERTKKNKYKYKF